MSTSSDQWYARLGVGIEFGPMPRADLDELAQSGQLLSSDSVRNSPDAEWFPAGDVPDLFSPAEPESSPEASDGWTRVSDVEDEPDEPAALAVVETPVPSASPDPEVDAIPVAESLDEFDFDVGTPEVDASASDTSASDARSERDADDSLDFELNLPEPDVTTASPRLPPDPTPAEAPVPTPTPVSPPVPRLKPEPVSTPAPVSPLAANLPPTPNSTPTSVSTSSPDPVAAPAEEADFKLDLPSELPPLVRRESRTSPAVARPLFENEDGPAKTIDRPEIPPATSINDPPISRVVNAETEPGSQAGGALLSSGAIRNPLRFVKPIAVIALLTGVVWWLLPGPEPNIYADYAAIYEQIQKRRSNPNSEGSWNEFVTQSKATIDEANPWLEETAQPGDRDKNLLLYAGRDLRQLLDAGLESEASHLERLDGFFRQLEEVYASSQ